MLSLAFERIIDEYSSMHTLISFQRCCNENLTLHYWHGGKICVLAILCKLKRTRMYLLSLLGLIMYHTHLDLTLPRGAFATSFFFYCSPTVICMQNIQRIIHAYFILTMWYCNDLWFILMHFNEFSFDNTLVSTSL